MLAAFCWAEVRTFIVKLRQVPAFPPQKGEVQHESKVWESSGLWKGWNLTAERWWKLNIYSQNLDFRPRWEDRGSWGDRKLNVNLDRIPFIHFSCSILKYPAGEFTFFDIYLCSCAAYAHYDDACCSCSLPSVGFVFEGSMSMKEVFLDLNLVLFICFPRSLYKSTIETAFFHPRRLFANHF